MKMSGKKPFVTVLRIGVHEDQEARSDVYHYHAQQPESDKAGGRYTYSLTDEVLHTYGHTGRALFLLTYCSPHRTYAKKQSQK